MECKDLEAVLEQEGLSPLPPSARDHLAECEGCRGLLADLSAIVVAAKRIPVEERPAERIWVSLRAQLEAEGIIRQPEVEVAFAQVSWRQGFAQLFRPRVLAMVGAGVLVVAGALYYANGPKKTGTPGVATLSQPTATPPDAPKEAEKPAPSPLKTPAPIISAESVTKNQPGRTAAAKASKPSQIRESTGDLLPSPSELASFGESAATLNQTERAMPSGGWANNAEVEAALRANLRTLNEFIKECETRLKENPRDQLTQEYLNMALQQKAELLNAMMDGGRSEH